MSTRSCGSSGSEYTAMSQARLAESSSAISSGCGPDAARRAPRRCAPALAAASAGRLVATGVRLAAGGGPTTASSTGWGSSEAPAWLRCSTSLAARA